MSQAVLIAIGIDWDGRRQILAVEMTLWIEQVLNAANTNGQRDTTLGNPAHVKLIKAVHPTKRRGERHRQFTAGLGRTYRAARLRCQRRTTRSILDLNQPISAP
jgi:hypothetical protein